jgi:hypothetical protein
LDTKYEIGRESKSVAEIHIHPDWNPHSVSFDADLAMLELEIPVSFNNYIQPICIWKSFNDPLENSGIIVGYGKSEDKSKNHESIPKVIDTPIHTQEDCFLKNPTLASLSSKRTFCGGYGNGTGVCLGDSGGGLIIQSNNIFYLRGIVSSSLVTNWQCDVNNYSIFTNVLKFKDWLQSFIMSSQEPTKPSVNSFHQNNNQRYPQENSQNRPSNPQQGSYESEGHKFADYKLITRFAWQLFKVGFDA